MMYKEMKLLLTGMLERGVISESHSPRAVPVVMAKKKDGSFALITGSWMQLHKDAFPLPPTEETLTTLTQAEWFSTLHLANGYWQVGVYLISKLVLQDGGLYKRMNDPSTHELHFQIICPASRWEVWRRDTCRGRTDTLKAEMPLLLAEDGGGCKGFPSGLCHLWPAEGKGRW